METSELNGSPHDLVWLHKAQRVFAKELDGLSAAEKHEYLVNIEQALEAALRSDLNREGCWDLNGRRVAAYRYTPTTVPADLAEDVGLSNNDVLIDVGVHSSEENELQQAMRADVWQFVLDSTDEGRCRREGCGRQIEVRTEVTMRPGVGTAWTVFPLCPASRVHIKMEEPPMLIVG